MDDLKKELLANAKQNKDIMMVQNMLVIIRR